MTAGDTFSPMALVFSRKSLLAWALLVAALAGTVFGCLEVRSTIDGRTRDEISFASDRVAAAVEQRLEAYALILRGGAGLFTASDDVTRAEWKQFADEMDAQNVVPGVQGVGYATVITPAELAAHTAAIRAEGFPDYEVHPIAARDVYTSIIYLEPFSGRNLRAFGYDMYTEATRRAAMDAARDSGTPTLSGKVRLVQETETDVQAGVLMYVAVYRRGMPTQTVEQRRAALQGWAYSPYRMNDLMSGILDGWETAEGRYLDLHIYQGQERTAENMLFDSTADDAPDPLSPFAQLRTVDFRGAMWTLAFDRIGSAPGVDYQPVWWTLLGGVVLSVLLFALVLSVRTTRENAHLIALRSTQELRDREGLLRASEQRWQFAVEGAGDGLWDWDIHTGTVFVSHRWKEMLGYSDEEIGTSFDEWGLRVHPDDVAHTRAVLQDCLDGRSASYASEHRLRCKDGTFLWVLDRGMVTNRADDGTPLRMIGTHKDISESRAAMAHIAHLSQLYRMLSECNSAVVRCSSPEELFDDICRVVVENAELAMAWIGLVEPVTGRIVPVASFGSGVAYLDDIEICVDADDPHGQGPTGTATRERRAVWTDDFAGSPNTAPWHERGARFGWVASAALPLSRHGETIGALTLYSTKSGWFDADTRALLEEMAADISFALEKLEAEATLQESEQRFRSLVEQSIAGTFIVRDGRFIYVNPRLKSMLGYDEDEDVTGRFVWEFVSPPDRAASAERIRSLMAGEVERSEGAFAAICKDGSTKDLATTSTKAVYRNQDVMIGLAQDVSERKVAEDRIHRYATQLERTFLQTVALATTLSEKRDPYTAGHEQRVAELAAAIGTSMGLDADRIEGLRVSGYLHDVGKISVPTEILVKPTRLSPLEESLIREHPNAGYEVLKEVDFPWPVAEVALQHHERLDGSGYPQGLKGDEILLEARIVAVADVVESMSSHRPYRAALGIEAALAEIESGIGTLYDPDVAWACIRLIREEGFLPTELVS